MHEGEDHRGNSDSEDKKASEIKGGFSPSHGRDAKKGHGQSNDGDRNIDPKNIMPTEIGSQSPADEGTNREENRSSTDEKPQSFTPLVGWKMEMIIP